MKTSKMLLRTGRDSRLALQALKSLAYYANSNRRAIGSEVHVRVMPRKFTRRMWAAL